MEELAFNWVDYVTAGIIIICMIFGLMSGFVMQLASIMSLTVGLLLYIFASPPVAKILNERWIDNYLMAKFAANILCFFGGSMAVRSLAQLLKGIIEKLKLQKFDRFLGGCTGILKGVFLCAIILLIGGRSGIARFEEPVQQSFSGKYIVAAADKVVDWAKEEDIIGRSKESGLKLLDKSKELLEKVKDKASEQKEEEIDKAEENEQSEQQLY
ncbi:MAG: CvpA family protein [Planctomycetota bacterium]|jgi:membrane protein required for colicin V production